MNYRKALTVLELKPNFTDEDLKMSYRKLSKIYHPDRHKEGTKLYFQMLMKQQEINEARDYLKNYQKKNSVHNSNKKTINLNHYKQEKINTLKKFINEDETIADKNFQETCEKIKNITYTFETDIWMSYVTTKQQVDSMYNLCIASIEKTLINFVVSFCKKNYINELEIKEKVNFGSNLVEFYNQLLKIKEKYSKEVKVNKQLDEEIEQYKTYIGYEELEYLVNICKKNTFYYIKKNNFQNIKKEIEQMHQQIKKEVFEVYYTIKKKILELEDIIKNENDEEIKKEYLNIINNFKLGISFNTTEEAIIKLEEHISKHQEMELKKQKQKTIEESINKIYQSLIVRYSEIIKKYNIVTESEKIKKTNEFLKEILQLFNKGCEEFKDLEFFTAFNNITFSDEMIDREIIENLQQLKQQDKESEKEQSKKWKPHFLNPKGYSEQVCNTDNNYYTNESNARRRG